MHLYLALRLRYSDHAFGLATNIMEITGHDVSDILEWTTVNLIEVTLRHWEYFSRPLDELREALSSSPLAKYLHGFSLPHREYWLVIDALAATLGQYHSDLHDQLEPVVRVMALEFDNLTVRHVGKSLYITVREGNHAAKPSAPGHPRY
jgi:hypothetical protein